MKSLSVLKGAIAVFVVAFILNIAVGSAWIERLLRVDPDGGSGTLEALFVVAPGIVAVTLAAVHQLLRRRAPA